ncbi:MAG TPA: hypothetical protein VHX60_10155 [Acidobacteriaceae bacterium]|nr:hypothetical protein [Acidobacteriaceae bacterium]
MIDEHSKAARHAEESAQRQNQEVAGVIASAIKAAHEDVPGYEKTQRDKEYRLQKRLFGATLLAAAVAAGYAAIAARQACIMQRTYGEIRAQTAASQQSAYASCLSAQIASRSLGVIEQQQKDSHIAAYSTTFQGVAAINARRSDVDIEVEEFGVGLGHPLELPVYIINRGETPARDVIAILRAEFIPRKGDVDISYPPKSISRTASPVLQKGESLPHHTTEGTNPVVAVRDLRTGDNVMATPQDMRDFGNGDKDLVVFGKISWKDDFGGRERTVCYMGYHEYPLERFTIEHPICQNYNKTRDYDDPWKITLDRNDAIPFPVLPQIECEKPTEE